MAKNSDHCKCCGSDSLFSGWFDADGFAVTHNITDTTFPDATWQTFCNDCGTQQDVPRRRSRKPVSPGA